MVLEAAEVARRAELARRIEVAKVDSFLQEKINQCKDSVWRHHRDGTTKMRALDRKNNPDVRETQIGIDLVTQKYYENLQTEYRNANEDVFAAIVEKEIGDEVIRA